MRYLDSLYKIKQHFNMSDNEAADDFNTVLGTAFEDASLADSQIDMGDNELTGEQSIMWYGILAIFHATLAGALYIGLQGYPLIRAFYEIMLSTEIAYWPVAIGWAAIALFDSEFSRELYKAVISISVLGPFAGHIIGFVFLFINAEASSLWNNWGFWVLWPLFLAYDVGQVLLQFFFLPTIFDFIKNEPLATA